MDLRGHGKSGKPHEVAQYGAEMAADVIRLLDHLKVPKAHLVGYSMGAIVAGKVAATHPDRVLSVVYGGQAPILTKKVKTDAREIDVFAKAVEEDKGLGATAPQAAGEIHTDFQRGFIRAETIGFDDYIAYLIEFMPAGKRKLTEKQANALAKFVYLGKDLKAFAAAGRGIKNLDVTAEQLQQCKAPILFVHGSKEADDTKERAAAIVKLLGRGEIKVIDDADHVSTLSKPEFGKIIDEFLRVNKQD